MCCLFGIIDYRDNFSGRQKSRFLQILANQCEARGTDATGIAYLEHGHLRIYKRPLPAHKLRFFLPSSARVIMGHTRMTTQGSEMRNYNNHPFQGSAGGCRFALAHNGVLYNDHDLRQGLQLPATNIETDSYVAVQLIERKRALSLDSLEYMAEQVEGSFMFTVLGEDGSLYFVKGDNPMCLLHFPKSGFYLYASTEEILGRALKKMRLCCERPVRVELGCGDILKIDPQGRQSKGKFDPAVLYGWGLPYSYSRAACAALSEEYSSYLEELKSVAGAFGYSPEAIERLYRCGMPPEEIEEFLYCGEY